MSYDCSIRSCSYSSKSPLGPARHAKTHKNDFEKIVGRPPDDYEEVRRLFNHGDPPEDVRVDVGAFATLDRFTEQDS